MAAARRSKQKEPLGECKDLLSPAAKARVNAFLRLWSLLPTKLDSCILPIHLRAPPTRPFGLAEIHSTRQTGTRKLLVATSHGATITLR